MTFIRFSRRRLLKITVSAVGFVSLPILSVEAWVPKSSFDLAERMSSFVAPHTSAVKLGLCVLKDVTDEPSLEALIVATVAGREDVPALRSQNDAALHDRLRHWIRDDFESGETVSVQGWILSRTETNLLALAAQLDRFKSVASVA